MKNYLSAGIQNKLINITGKDLISCIISEMKDSTFFSIMADEATSYNNKVCAFCIRFIDGDNNVRKELIKFITLIRITEEAIASAIKQTLEKLGLELS